MLVTVIYGNSFPNYIEYSNEYNIYKVHFDIVKNNNIYNYKEIVFNYLPDINSIRKEINNYYNRETDYKILNFFKYNNITIWLSSENQINYSNAAIAGLSYLKIKGGTDENPEYLELNSKEEIISFVNAMQNYINVCIEEGWNKKDSINYDLYK